MSFNYRNRKYSDKRAHLSVAFVALLFIRLSTLDPLLNPCKHLPLMLKKHLIQPRLGRPLQSAVSLGGFATVLVVPYAVGVGDED